MERRRHVFSSTQSNIEAALAAIESFASVCADDDEDLKHRLLVAATEAATNAMRHGNRFDPRKQVVIELECDGERVRVMVEDEGNGFDPGQLPDPLQEENLLKPGGRGVYLMTLLADEVQFENGGRRVRLVFHCNAAPTDERAA